MARGFYLRLLVTIAIASLVLGAIEFDDDYEYEEEEEVVVTQKPVSKKKESTASALKTTRPKTSEDTREVKFELEHSLGDEFTKCGTFTAQVLEQVTGPSTVVKVTQVKLQRDPISSKQQKQLAALLESGGYYRLRVPTSIFTHQSLPGRWAVASLPLKCVVNAGLHESLVLHLDDQGHIAALDYSTPAGECNQEDAMPPNKWDFHPLAYVRLPKDAPRLNPDYAMNYHAPPTPGDKADPEATNGDGLAQAPPDATPKKEPQSFFKKYWMYIIPAGLVLLNGVLAPPEQPGQAGARRAAK